MATIYFLKMDIFSAISTQKDIANIFTTYEKDRYFDIIKLYDIPFYKKLLYRLSLPGKQLMLHNDLQPKNILYSPETKQISLIDMDSIGCSNFGFFMLRFFNYYPQNNKKIIYNEVAKIFNRRLNPVTLNTLFAIQKIKTVFQRIK